jgi:lipoprotein signal peptidase
MYDTMLLLTSSALSLMILSFLYKHNFFFSLASHVFIGGVTAYTTAVNIQNIYKQGVLPVMNGQYLYIFALALGALLFLRFFTKYSWWVRVPMAMLIGTGIGINMATGIQASVITQIRDTMRSVFNVSYITNINNFIVIVGVVCVTLFFFFSKEEKGILKPIHKTGRYFLMVAFGASFGYALLGNTSLIISKISVLISYPSYYLLIIAIAVVVYDALKIRKKN